jgi:hypothetical protein
MKSGRPLDSDSIATPLSRRRFLGLALVGAGVIGAAGFRFLEIAGRWEPLIPAKRKTLTRLECATLTALFEVLMEERDAAVLKEALTRADELISNFSRFERLELAGALVLVEQVLGGVLSRFSSLPASDRSAALACARDSSGVRRDIYIGMKELASLAIYSGSSRWREIGYAGPLVGEAPRGEERARKLREGFLGDSWAGGASS